jgi:hypothetical protein
MINKIQFYIPKDERIPTDLRLCVRRSAEKEVLVDDVYVTYRRIESGFLFIISLKDEEEAMRIAEDIVQVMKEDHDESQHGVSWRTVSLSVIPQEERYRIDTLVEWKYRVRDSY